MSSNKSLLLRFFIHCILLCVVFTSEVVILDNKNFEHLTQASTGATTGDWFIEFYAPWCGHCRRLQPAWEELAENLKGEINVAKVDCSTNAGVCARFKIRGYPTLKLFHKGSMYDFRGPRDTDSLTSFVRGDFKLNAPTPVPPPPTFLDSVKQQFDEVMESLQVVYYQVLKDVQGVYMGEKKVDMPFVLMIASIFFLASFIILIISSIFIGGPEPLREKQE